MLFPYLLKVSFLLAVLTLSYRWLIQYETFSKINRFLLIFNVLAAWLLPLIPLAAWGPVEVQKEFHQTIPEILKTVPLEPEKIIAIYPSINVTNQLSPEWSRMDWILAIYFLGVIYWALAFLYQIVKLLRALWKLPSEKLDRNVTLILDERCNSPYSFFSWIVCNPKAYPENAFQHILAHETEHALQHHSLDLLLAEFQRILLWFNPFAWFHCKLVQENLEFLADRAVLESGFERKQYQFNLLKVALQTRELPLTNSFAQSLLKKRIKMMNRKPSDLWVCGKYITLIILLYLSSAFVAPYKKQFIAFVPPVMKPIVKVLTENNNPVIEIPDKKDVVKYLSEQEKITKPVSSKIIETSLPIDSPQVKKNKWTLLKNDTLYWAISPLATFDDINEVRQEVKNFGYDMIVNMMQYDPLQLYITSFNLITKSNDFNYGISKIKGESYMPIQGPYGFFTKHVDQSGGQRPPEPLNQNLRNDYQKALALRKRNQITYFEDRLNENRGNESRRRSRLTYDKKTLEGQDAAKILAKEGIGKSELNNTLKVNELHKNAEYYLDSNPTTLAELNEVSFDQFENIHVITVITDKIFKKYILVTTK